MKILETTIIDKLRESELYVNLEELKVLKDCTKNSFNQILGAQSTLEKYPYLKNDISDRISNKKLFQPGRIVETIITQTISDSLGCDYVGDGYYQNEFYKIKQDGGSGMPDVVLCDLINKTEIILEIKEPFAYGKTCGFTYDESGKPKEFTSKNQKFRNHIKSLFSSDDLLGKYNILDNQGHNVYLETKDVISTSFNYIVSYTESGNLIFMTEDEYKKMFGFKIEIRSCGRNTRKVFTPNKLKLDNGLLYFTKSDVSEITQRGGTKSSRYKYISNNATFSFKKQDVKTDGDIFYIPLGKIKQHLGDVSVQHYIL